jgi:hypothetical protein
MEVTVFADTDEEMFMAIQHEPSNPWFTFNTLDVHARPIEIVE